jgi:hypothetical protein
LLSHKERKIKKERAEKKQKKNNSKTSGLKKRDLDL